MQHSMRAECYQHRPGLHIGLKAAALVETLQHYVYNLKKLYKFCWEYK